MASADSEFLGRNGSYDVTNASEKRPLMDRLKNKADNFREYLATTCCACLASVPSFALIVLAVVLVMLLIASIPMAFAFSYMNTDARTSDVPNASVRVFREHDVWTNAGQKLPDLISQSSSLLPPRINACKGFGFACTSEPSHIIGTYQRCDGVKDCADGSDEIDCHRCQTTLSCSENGHSDRKICLRGNSICDGVQQCSDGADEKAYCRAECATGQRKCKDANICLSDSMICDGDAHCPDGEDERNCTECKNGAKLCKSEKTCIPKWKLCDGRMDCTDNSDEMECDCKTCSADDTAICNGEHKMCLKKNKICDGTADCPDAEDEENCPGTCKIDIVSNNSSSANVSSSASNSTSANQTSKLGTVKCSDGKFYNWRYGCGGFIKSCDGHCSECNPETSFNCNANSNSSNKVTRCIHRSNVCNGVDDCGNNADEQGCDCKGDDVKRCSSPSYSGKHKCFSSSQQCDGFNDCPDGEDEKDCKKCSNGGFLCAAEKKCIPGIKRCDGIEDCKDKSDEEKCSCQDCKLHPFKMYMCASGDRCFRLSNACNPYTQCPNRDDRDKLYCAVNRGGGQSYL